MPNHPNPALRDRYVCSTGPRARPGKAWNGRVWAAFLAAGLGLGAHAPGIHACSTLLAAREATADGSVLLSHSCDGDVMGLVQVMPARTYPPGTRLPMYWNVPRPKTYAEYAAHRREGYQHTGWLPVTETYRSLILGGNVESMITGGLNEHGLNIAIEFLPMREGLACDRGRVGPNSNHWTTSLIANGLLRARTAREAIRLIGAMVEEYGFLYYRAPHAGVALPIADANEAWLMEIFGPGTDWTPEGGRPGGVWCAQRIPDGEVGCSANRSRIGVIDPADREHFLVSSNVFSLAEHLGFWQPGTPFVWHDVYGDPGSRANSLREWRALSLVAPSREFSFTDDPRRDRYPFSVRPDRSLSVPELMAIMRDTYAGTAYDVAAQAAFQTAAGPSPLACPWGPPEVLDLLGLEPERALCTPTSGYVFVAQLRKNLPPPVGNLLWFAYGPADTSCFLPLYAGIDDLPDTWDHPANFTRIDRQQPQWTFRLVHNLSHRLGYQRVLQDVQAMIHPAERRFLDLQPELEAAALRRLEQAGPAALSRLLTDYAATCTTQVGDAYRELVDYLVWRHLVPDPAFAPATRPRIPAPTVPDAREADNVDETAEPTADFGESPVPRSEPRPSPLVRVEEAPDPSAEGLACFKVSTPGATYFLERSGGGLSSLLDRDGRDWLGFHPAPGSGSGGEYRGFPNAVHQQAGNYFHPRNQATDPSTTRLLTAEPDRVTIGVRAHNGLWEGEYEFRPTHATFTMQRMPPTHRYWVLYEGTPGGQFDLDDWWMTSTVSEPQPMTTRHDDDLAAPEWIVFGDRGNDRVLFLLHHEDDAHPDRFYQMNEQMTVFGFGRGGLDKFLDSVPQRFSIGFLETTRHAAITRALHSLAEGASTGPPGLDPGGATAADGP